MEWSWLWLRMKIICYSTDSLSVTSFYTAPVSFIDFPIPSYSISCCTAQSHEKKAINKTQTFLSSLVAWNTRRQAADIHLHNRDLSSGVGGQQRCGQLLLCSCSCTPSTGERIIFFQQPPARGLGPRHWEDNSDVEHALNEMVPNRGNFSLAQKTDFVNLSPKQVDRKHSKTM